MMKNILVVVFLLITGAFFKVFGQEAQIFSVEDFDLRGNVKSCLVITKYGKEEYEFDAKSRLIKSVTRYSDTDYDITRYKFEKDELTEKRTENYRDGKFDPSISFGNFYTVEKSEPRVVIEKVFSYEKEFLDSYQYTYNEAGKLKAILHSGADGENETVIEHSEKGNISEQTYSLNGVIKKSVKITIDKIENTKTEFTVQYLDGIKTSAVKKVFNKYEQLISESQMSFDTNTKKFIATEKKKYSYVQSGVKNKLITTIGNSESTHQYIYQFDNEETGNWVKEIIAPDNLYTTRKIEYFPEVKPDKKE
ncbi:hypothetical protein JQC67_14830 [Aurantibacter crassamenti]|uniref:hypothetical protein n=1 Tax=Aurantibacter crassamenti TaxID=1837375 RepID=UPI0019393CD6|nr:hypothetical protein [Aurantibacter crassamenti]MBM1107427.1 hypothetical protein [Aurantibacter crassamenti]